MTSLGLSLAYTAVELVPSTHAGTTKRDVASTLHLPDVLETNVGTAVKFDIRSDRIEPQIDVEFNDGEKLIFKTGNLSHLEILDYLYEYVDEKDPKKHEGPELVTKSSKVASKMKGKRK
ncbi:large ribosomal subunit protein mL53-like isoform X2 [Physella acuta]|uniref:large ribosomal subunit protein mL53-like isoform X2 n=1 Tax=Physella acuta TaxID=109671 RepID=UPI0027DB6A24|nr:large ribosomal subunit protein mL53-like isoform X2 [Physella acuta]